MPTRPVESGRGLVRQDHAEVEIAVRTAITTGGGAEQIDTLRVVVVHQTTRDLRDGLVLGHAPLSCTRVNAGGWRRGGDSNSRYPLRYARFRGGCDRPLCHLSRVLLISFETPPFDFPPGAG